MPGHVSFVGAGPGAADLLTLRAMLRLQSAEVVLYDALTDASLRSVAPHAQWVDVGKRGHCAGATPQARIDALLVGMARQYAKVVRLKGGDPSIFGRLEEEIAALQANGIGFDIVPGITAALAAAADSARPLTRRGRGRSVALTTAVTAEGQLRGGRHADTEVFYMAGRQLGALGRRLLQDGWSPDTSVLVVSRAGCPDVLSSSHFLQELAHATLLHSGRPTVVTVGAGAQAVGYPPVAAVKAQPVKQPSAAA
jgi:uroporphyrin-III C-methyltransferase